MNTSTILIELVEKFKRNSLQAFTAPIRLTLKAKKKKRQRALRNREAQVWEIATMEVSWAIERLAVELRKRAEPGSVIEKREEEPLKAAPYVPKVWFSGESMREPVMTGASEPRFFFTDMINAAAFALAIPSNWCSRWRFLSNGKEAHVEEATSSRLPQITEPSCCDPSAGLQRLRRRIRFLPSTTHEIHSLRKYILRGTAASAMQPVL